MANHTGDEVSWNTSQGRTHGTVKDQRSNDFTFDGQQFRPADGDPYYLVESDTTGARAAHHESALRPREARS